MCMTDEFQTVLGDRKSMRQVAELYEKTYGVKVELKNLGTLDELKARMTQTLKENPQNPFAWMGMHYT
jgi:hypothetical protein